MEVIVDARKNGASWSGEGPWANLPATLRVLFITGTLRGGNWLAKAFSGDSACQVKLEHVVGIATGLARLRDDVYDVVLLQHDPETLDAPEVLGTVRTASREDQPILVLGSEPEEHLAALCLEAGGDGYVCLKHTTTRMLLWKIALAWERHLLVAENRRLRQARQHQLMLEHDEASRLLCQQRQLLDELRSLHASVGSKERSSPEVSTIPPLLAAHYRELLRTYVIMGTGNLAEELQRLAELFVRAGLGPHHVMHIHLHVLEEMVRGLGSRSARHVMNRADLLILEAVMKLAETYRRRCLERYQPPEQLYLPGMDPQDTWREAMQGPPAGRAA